MVGQLVGTGSVVFWFGFSLSVNDHLYNSSETNRLFRIVDMDGSGTIDINELFEVFRLSTTAKQIPESAAVEEAAVAAAVEREAAAAAAAGRQQVTDWLQNNQFEEYTAQLVDIGLEESLEDFEFISLGDLLTDVGMPEVEADRFVMERDAWLQANKKDDSDDDYVAI